MHHITLGYHTEHGVDEVYLSIPCTFTTLPQEIINLINQDPNMRMSLSDENILGFHNHNVINCGNKYKYSSYEGILLQATEKYPGVTIKFEQLLKSPKINLAPPHKVSTSKHAGYSLTFEDYAIVISLENKCVTGKISNCAQKVQSALNSSRLRVLGLSHGCKIDFEKATIRFTTNKNMHASSYELKLHITKKIEIILQDLDLSTNTELANKSPAKTTRKSFLSTLL